MSRRHSSSYNPQPPPPPVSVPVTVQSPAVSPFSGILSKLLSGKQAVPIAFPKASLPVGEILGGVSNTVRGLVMNDNWWILLLIIFLFFPSVSSKMFGGFLKD